MARTTQEIYDALITEKNTMTELDTLQPNVDAAQTLLSDLSNNSKVQDWRLWIWLVAWAIHIHEGFWDMFKTEINDIASTVNYGHLNWYRYMALNYQHGHDIVYTNNSFQYATSDPASKIITKAAASEIPITQEVLVKVAKDGGVPLNTSELNAFKAYIDEIAPAGINTSVISQDPDDLKLEIEVIYDPLVLASDGSLLSSSTVFPIEDAINNHINNIDFDGDITKTFLQDSIQAAEGVINPIIVNVWTRVGVAAYVEIGQEATAQSGHFRIDPAIPLNTQITYTPNA